MILGLLDTVFAATLTVGPSGTYGVPSQAAAVAQDGDIVEIEAGTYTGDVASWTADDLTIRGVGGYAHLEAAGSHAQGKAIWVISGDDTIVEWIAFSGASVPDGNGAGIRQEGAGLTVSHCWFYDNENGILAGDNDQSDIVVEYSIFDNNGAGDGFTHNMYINHVNSFVLRHSWTHQPVNGHNVKSRAYATTIAYNRISEGADGVGSYQIDLPNGGFAVVMGNVVQQAATAANSGMLSFAAEGASNPDQKLFIVGNTFVNERSAGTFIANHGATEAVVRNNIFQGHGTVVSGAAVQEANLVTTDDPGFVDLEGYDYRLVKGSAAVDSATAPGMADSLDLTPLWQYAGDADRQARPDDGVLDIGAFEYSEVVEDTGDTGSPGTDGGTGDTGEGADTGNTGGDGSGTGGGGSPADEDSASDTGAHGGEEARSCGCASTSPAGPAWTLLLMLGAAARRRQVS